MGFGLRLTHRGSRHYGVTMCLAMEGRSDGAKGTVQDGNAVNACATLITIKQSLLTQYLPSRHARTSLSVVLCAGLAA